MYLARFRAAAPLLLFAALVARAVPAAAQGSDPVSFRTSNVNARYLAGVRGEVDRFRQGWLAAWEADDLRRLRPLIADDAVFVLGADTRLEGRREIEGDLAKRLPGLRQLSQSVAQFSTSGDLAYEMGTLTFLTDAEGGAGQYAHEGTYSAVMKRRTNNEWQMLSFVVAERADARLIPPTPPPSPPAADEEDAAPASSGAKSSAALEVEAVVRRLSDAIRTGDSTVVRDLFFPGARLLSVGVAEGRPVAQIGQVNDFVTSVGAPKPAPVDERIGEVDVRVEGVLASAWANYTFYVGDRVSHCGVNAYQLFRGEQGWQIVQLTDTRSSGTCRPIRRP
ncbi:MAG TPA: nuclear transport factor 2 family protein [Longimicrobium sp.]|nr:nuclear transport factor 2 family protein [Longimicrobium sp.]